MDIIPISIVTHNSSDIFVTLDNLAEVVSKYPMFKVVIYDNDSTVEYKVKLKKYDFVQLIEADTNLGFGHGHNQVLNAESARWGLICNPDIIVKAEDLELLLSKAHQTSDVAAVVPKVLNEDGTTQFLVRRRLAVFDYFLRFIPFKFVKRLFDDRLARFECRDLPDDRDSFINMGSGCFMLVDIEKFKEIGGFDERFFMYFEDNDLCLRFGQAGYKILYTPQAAVVHLYGKGAHRSKTLFKIFMKSMGQFFNKWGWRIF